MDASIYCLFPKVVYLKNIDYINDKYLLSLNNFCKKLKYVEIPKEESENVSQTSEDRYLFDNHKELFKLKDIILKEFNYFKNNKKNVSNNFQHFPHIDNYYNALVYLDKICSGGTAIYDMPSIVNTEQYNLLYDISNYSKRVIKAIPNRLVIFNGRQMHGGYIEDHNKYVNNWRFNQVLFFRQV